MQNKTEEPQTNDWNIFSDWYPPKEEKAENMEWEVFEDLITYYEQVVENKYGELTSLLKEWDKKIVDLGGDPTYLNWDLFRPLRLNREEDWSDWLSHLIATSKTGLFSKYLLDAEDAFDLVYKNPEKVEREVGCDEFRADIVVLWQGDHFTHIEVKVGDENLEKTFKTSTRLMKKYDSDPRKWSNVILLLSNQLSHWDALQSTQNTDVNIKVISWEDVCVAIRRALLSKDEDIKWKIWSYSLLGAIEQKLIGFQGYRLCEKPIEGLEEKIYILKKSFNYE